MNKQAPLYKIGDLLIELVDGLDLSTGLITEIYFDDLDKEYVYRIMWNDMSGQTEIFESIIKWRIDNSIFTYHGVIE